MAWKKVDEVPSGPGIFFHGDPKALPQRWWLFGLWRLQWRWETLKVDLPHQLARAGFHLYFQSGPERMVYEDLLRCSYIQIRIGPGDVTFIAATPSGAVLPMDWSMAEEARSLRCSIVRI